MIKIPKRKVGRPATGRDPLVSFRVPEHLKARVEGAARYMKRPTSEVYREALYLGLEQLHGERAERGEYLPGGLRPEHNAEIHEAGHAVAAWLIAEELGEDPSHVVDHIALKRKGAGHVLSKWPKLVCHPKLDVAFTIAGGVATAVRTGVPFEEVWQSHECSGDRKMVERIAKREGKDYTSKAAAWAQKRFRDEDTWEALLHVARKLAHGKCEGWIAWLAFETKREWCRKRGMRASAHFGEADDDPYQSRQWLRRKRKEAAAS